MVLQCFVKESQIQIPYSEFNYALFTSISVVIGIGTRHTNNSVIRPLLVCMFITSTVLITAYNCNLVSFLTLPTHERPIDTLEDFVYSNLQWGTDDIAWVEYFEDISDEYLRDIAKKYFMIKDLEHFNKLAKDGLVAALVEKLSSGRFTNTHYIYDDTLNHMRLMKEVPFTRPIVFIFPRGSPIGYELNNILRYLRDSGIVSKWEIDVVDTYQTTNQLLLLIQKQQAVQDIRSLSMDDMDGGFLLLLIGYGLSGIMFIIETFIYTVNGFTV